MPKLRRKHHSTVQSRNDKGIYARSCGSILHPESDSPFEHLYEVAKGSRSHLKRLSTLDQQTLIEKNYIKKWTKYICNRCVSKGLNHHDHVNKSTTDEAADESSHHAKVEEDAEPEVSSSLGARCKLVGIDIDSVLKKDVTELYKKRNYNIDDILNYSPDTWIGERPEELVVLLKHLCSVENETFDDKKSYLLAKVVEQIYHLRNSQIVLPLSLRENILLYSYSSSKQATTFVHNVGPAGSYRTILRCLDASAEEEIAFPTGVCRVAFDNNQVIGKTYVVSGDNQVPSSVMCSTAYMQLDSTTIQKDEKLKPTNWMWQEVSDEQKKDLLVFTDKYDNTFRNSRDIHISKNIAEIVSELSSGKNDKIDEYAEKLANVENEKVCIECGGANDRTYRVCRNCQGQLTIPQEVDFSNFESGSTSCDPYAAFSRLETNENAATVIPGEPLFLNPNSYATIVEVLRNLGQHAGIVQYGGEDRHWLFVECDGLPYKIMRDIIDNVWFCASCKQSYYGLPQFEEHMCHVLGRSSKQREFSWVVPIVGLFHLELNLTRSFLALNWEVFVSTLARTLGFKSDKAQQYIKKGSDHHKSWNLLEIIYLALSKELVHPYVKNCIESDKEATIEGYWEWSDGEVKNPNFTYMQQMAFTYLHALMMLRTGVRHNNTEAISAAKAKLVHLLYSQNHPKYQEILYRDMRDQILMPREVFETLERSFTLSRTGRKNHYQGGDACLEEINKEAKAWLKLGGGVPNTNRWTRIFRNLQKLKKVSEETVHATQPSVPGPSAEPDLPKQRRRREVARTRATLRKSGYLTSPTEPTKQTSMDGSTPLNPELVNYSVTAKSMAESYVDAALGGTASKMRKIHVTANEVKESQKIENMTVARIQERIRHELAKLPTLQASQLEESYHSTVRSGLKRKHIDFYHLVVEELNLIEVSADGENE